MIPVSNISVVGLSSSMVGAERWIGQRSVSELMSAPEVDRLAEQVEDAAERLAADRNGDRPTGVHDLGATREAVRGVHRDRAHAVVAEVLLDLEHEHVAGVDLLVELGSRGRRTLDREGVVDLGQLVR